MVVFHDRFSRFAKKFTAQMLSNGTPEFAELMSKMIRLASCDKPVSMREW